MTLEVPISAPRAKVWQALTTGLGAWWPRDFLASPGSGGMELEVEVGGRMFEQAPSGDGVLWARVTAIRAPELLTMTGQFGPPFGGPVATVMNWTLRDEGKGTVLRIDDYMFGVISESMKANIAQGWKYLFEGAMKPHVEGKK